MNPRRSWMIVPAHDGDAETRCKEFKPDVVVLDLEYSVPPKHKERARSSLAGLLRKGSHRQPARRAPSTDLESDAPRR